MGRETASCLAVVVLLGCADFKAAESPPAGGGSGDSTGDPGPSTSSGEESGAQGASGSTAGSSTTGPTDDDTSTMGMDDDGESSGSAVGDDTSGGSEAELPYAGDYAGTFSGDCGLGFEGTVTATIDLSGLITGTASASGQSAPVSGLVSNVGVLSGSLTVLGIPCTLAGTMADDGSGGSGMFSCPSVDCSGPWSLSAL